MKKLIVCMMLSLFASVGMAQINSGSLSGKTAIIKKGETGKVLSEVRLDGLKKQIAPLTFSAEQEQQLLTLITSIIEENSKIMRKYFEQGDSLVFHVRKLMLKREGEYKKIFTEKQWQNYQAYREKMQTEAQKYKEKLDQSGGMLKEE